MSYQVPPDIERLVSEQMQQGAYSSEDEVLRDALDHWLSGTPIWPPFERELRIWKPAAFSRCPKLTRKSGEI